MQMHILVEMPKEMFKYIGNPDTLRAGDSFSIGGDIRIKFWHLAENEQRQRFIPLFTSAEVFDKEVQPV